MEPECSSKGNRDKGSVILLGSVLRKIARNVAKNMLNSNQRGRNILDQQKENRRKEHKLLKGCVSR